MVHLLIGASATTAFIHIINYTQRRNLKVAWWKWILTILNLLYAVFILEVIAGFLEEGAVRGALVMGVIMGIVAVIWGVLLWRFVFSHRMK
jgi:hypothetical protein